jgi:hypothetical protein
MAEIIAAFDHSGDIRVQEQALDFSFLRRIALLDLRRHRHKGGVVMRFR